MLSTYTNTQTLLSFSLSFSFSFSFVSRKEGSVNANSSYYLLTFCEDGVFEAYPVSSWSVAHQLAQYVSLHGYTQLHRSNIHLLINSIMLSWQSRHQEVFLTPCLCSGVRHTLFHVSTCMYIYMHVCWCCNLLYYVCRRDLPQLPDHSECFLGA